MSIWIYQNAPFVMKEKEITEKSLYGFVYIITTPSEQQYVGRKYFWSKKILKALKGRKNKRHRIIESNWRTYTSSSKIVNAEITRDGIEKFTFEIVSLHNNKTETNYSELKLQFLLNVLEETDANGKHCYLNNNIARHFYKSEKFQTHRQSITESYSRL